MLGKLVSEATRQEIENNPDFLMTMATNRFTKTMVTAFRVVSESEKPKTSARVKYIFSSNISRFMDSYNRVLQIH